MPKPEDMDFTEKIAPKGERPQVQKNLPQSADLTEHISAKQEQRPRQNTRRPARPAQSAVRDNTQHSGVQVAQTTENRVPSTESQPPRVQEPQGQRVTQQAAQPRAPRAESQPLRAQEPQGQRVPQQAAQPRAPRAESQPPRAQEPQGQRAPQQAAQPRAPRAEGQPQQAAQPRAQAAQSPQRTTPARTPQPPRVPLAAEPSAQDAPQEKGAKRQSQPRRKTPVRIIPLGGLLEIGKNLTVIECGTDMIIVDCGLSFPDEDMPGVDIVIPDFTYIEKNRERLRGIVVTHGHEDHIGGLAYLLKTVNAPVYSARLTIGLIEGKLKEHGLYGKVKMNVIKPGDTVKFGCLAVEAIHVNHSIPDALSFAIHTPAGVIIMTGDFKIDATPIEGGMIDLARFGELGRRGVLALLMDSTNATKPGMTPSERTVGAGFANLFQRAQDKRIIIASFASNIHRIQQIVDYAVKYKRKVAVSGRSMVNVVTIATELGYLKVPEGLLVEIEAIGRYRPDQIVIITTGSQGEPMSALSRMSMGDHRKVTVTPSDFIIISASPIPGNEKTVGRVINELLKLGAEVIYERMYDVHVSGHACQEELKMILGLTKPQFFIPVHGEFVHLRKNAENAIAMGIDPKNILLPEIGRVIELDGVDMKVTGTVPSGRVMVDGLGVGDVGSIVLRDRKHLAEDGLIIVVASINAQTGEIMAGPDMISRGFVYVREAEDMMAQARHIAKKVIESCLTNNVREWGNIKNRIKDDVGDYLWQMTKRTPMILPVIQEI